MHQCKRTCYWVLEVLVFVLQSGPQLLKVYLYDGTPCNMWSSLAIKRAEMLFVWISIPFVCKGSGTCGTEVMQNFCCCVYYVSLNCNEVSTKSNFGCNMTPYKIIGLTLIRMNGIKPAILCHDYVDETFSISSTSYTF